MLQIPDPKEFDNRPVVHQFDQQLGGDLARLLYRLADRRQARLRNELPLLRGR